jgi:hypothetical protein
MSGLEQQTARDLAAWLDDADEPLSTGAAEGLRRWVTKTAIVLAFGEVDARRFMSDPTATAVPDITTAKAVASGESLDHVFVGAARTDRSAFLWGAGNATVEPRGHDRISSRAVNVAALNLGTLQLWVVIPIVRPDALRLPDAVVIAGGGLRSRDLQWRSPDLDPTQVWAHYSDETSAAFFRALARAQGVLSDD